MKNIVILGSTGSVGRQTLEVVAAHPEEFKVLALGCHFEIDALRAQIALFHPQFVAVAQATAGQKLARQLRGKKVKIFWGDDALVKIATLPEAAMVVVAVAGSVGILPTLAAIRAKKDIALATKEVMVVAGDLVNGEVAKNKVRLIPVDSEHSAIFQCLRGGRQTEVNKIYLTCSGGAFRGRKKKDLEGVGPADALRHPNWQMGPKITVDCATLMNKGLELIEAQKLFGLAVDQIEIVIHPQSIVHSMVEFRDGSIIAQLGPTDMRFPIRYALSYPQRLKNHFEFLNLYTLKHLNFLEPDRETFTCLGLALQAAKTGGTLPVVLNAADEIAVALFLKKKIKFLEIPQMVKKTMLQHTVVAQPNLAQIFAADKWARQEAGRGFLIQ